MNSFILRLQNAELIREWTILKCDHSADKQRMGDGDTLCELFWGKLINVTNIKGGRAGDLKLSTASKS